MKIKIITHHTVHNHGALLQLYALMQVLKKYDSNVNALDYNKNYDFLESYAQVKYNISMKSIPYYLSFLKEKGIKRTLFNIEKKVILDRFKTKNLMIGEYYSKCDNLDAVFIGSDEVFSIEPGLNTVFWGMGVPAPNIFSYAGCFGPTTIEFIKEKYAEEYIEAGVKRIKRISVRDKNSKQIIERYTHAEVQQVCDPVILYGYNEEKKNFVRPIKEKYIVVYSYDENMNNIKEYNEILHYAQEKKLKVISVGFYHKWCNRCINVDPIELLCWICFAEYVVTDTFHGVVMSIIMNTDFATKIRGNRNKLGYLLEEYGLQNREISDFKELNSIFSTNINYNEVNKKIYKKRKEGLKFIDECISLI